VSRDIHLRFPSILGEGLRVRAKFRSKKKSPTFREGIFKIGIDLLLRALDQLPSAQPGLTTLFGPDSYREGRGAFKISVKKKSLRDYSRRDF
jgi:hypothetical protein